jgi:hypothetical protein
MAYVWAGIAILIIWGIARIVRWWNLPAVAEARAEKVKVRQIERTKRVLARRGWKNPPQQLVDKYIEIDNAKPKRRFLFWRRRKE